MKTHDDARGDWGRRARLLALLPSMLLIVVALGQITCAKTSLLSPWKGGGFGMFSALDGISHRPLRVFAVMADGDRRVVRLPVSRLRQHSSVRGFPSDAALRRVAREIEDAVVQAEPDATALVVEVWRLRFEPQTSSVRYVRWRAARSEISSEDQELAIDAAEDSLEP